LFNKIGIELPLVIANDHGQLNEVPTQHQSEHREDTLVLMTRKTGAYDVEIGQRIRAQRLSRGMSQEDLAERLGITFQQVQKYEKGGNRVTAARLREIANALKLPIVSFYGHDSYASDNGSRKNGEASDLHVQEFITSTRAINLLKHFAQIKDPSVQNMVVFLCEQLAEKQADD